MVAFAARRDGRDARWLHQAAYVHAIRTAIDLGVPRLALGTCRPSLADGVLRYKRKWGARLVPPSTRDAFLLRYRHTAGVRAALGATPLIVDRGGAGLAALAATDGAAPHDVAEALHLPGLATLAVLVPHPAGATAPGGVGVEPVAPPAVWPPEARLR